jgi:hypothetical protein
VAPPCLCERRASRDRILPVVLLFGASNLENLFDVAVAVIGTLAFYVALAQ